MRAITLAICGLVVTAVFVGGCGSVKQYVPFSPASSALRVPSQQRLVATAIGEAVNAACRQRSLDLKSFAGKTAEVEVNGVLPHSRADLLDYVASSVEFELAKAGIVVLPRTRSAAGAVAFHVKTDAPAPALLGSLAKQPDVRIVASVDWGGIDYTDKKYVNGGKVAGMVLVGLVTFGVGALIWRIAESPMSHTFTLDARAKITLRAIPTGAGLRATRGSGEGSSRVVVDTQSDEGYTLHMAPPKRN